MVWHSKEFYRRREYITDLKVGKGCADCGFAGHHSALDFDHRPGQTKLFNGFMNNLVSYSWDKILAEIAKCDVVCANCHRIRSFKRSQKESWTQEGNWCGGEVDYDLECQEALVAVGVRTFHVTGEEA